MQPKHQTEKLKTIRDLACVFLPVFLWLFPWTFGPTPSVLQSLVTLGLVGAWWGMQRTMVSSSQVTAQQIAMGWFVAASISALMGLVQYFQLTGFFGGLIQGAEPGQVYANLRQRNQFATLTTIGLTALICREALPGAHDTQAPRWASWLAVLLAVACVASGSRTGFVQFVLLVTLYGWWQGAAGVLRDPVVRAAVVGYIVAALVFALLGAWQQVGGGIWGRVQEAAPSCSSRLVLWSNVLHLIQLKPWTGWGWGELSFAHFIALYPGERFCDILDNAHNLPLHLAAELGLPLATVVCGVAAWWIARSQPWRETDPVRRMAWAVLALLGLHSMLEYPLWYGPFQLALVCSLWLLWRRPVHSDLTDEAQKMPEFTDWRALAATSLIAIAGWIGWSYWRVSQLYLPPEARAQAYREDTLRKVQDSWLFQNQVQFAALTTTPLTRENAAQQHAMALKLLHFSPEPSVVQRVIESAVMLGRDDEALYYLQRFKAAFPQAHAQWAAQ